jgi:hypothetical protein
LRTSPSPRIPPAISSLPKDQSTERIDGIVALLIAIGRAMVVQEESPLSYQVFWV